MFELFTRQERVAILVVCATGFLGLAVSRIGWGWVSPGQGTAASSTISLNDASAEQLESLPGIGPKLARRIVDDRRLHGKFLSVRDLDRVDGVSPKLTARLKSRLRLE